MKKNMILFGFIIVVAIGIGCFHKISKDSSSKYLDNSTLIYETTVSPNEVYTNIEKDKVFYTVQIYQNKNNSILIKASSNSTFFDDIQYEVKWDKKILESDVKIEWTTLMGNANSSPEDQIGIAVVSISSNNEIFSQRKINFANKAIDIVRDTIDNSNEI